MLGNWLWPAFLYVLYFDHTGSEPHLERRSIIGWDCNLIDLECHKSRLSSCKANQCQIETYASLEPINSIVFSTSRVHSSSGIYYFSSFRAGTSDCQYLLMKGNATVCFSLKTFQWVSYFIFLANIETQG